MSGAMGMKNIYAALVGLCLAVGGCPLLAGQTSHQASSNKSPEYTFTVVHVFPHDTSAYTQGLAYRDGFLYEGTGRNGQSSLRKVRLETGEVVQRSIWGPSFSVKASPSSKVKSSS